MQLPTQNCYKVDDSIVPMPKYLGALGMPGMTAYFGILHVGKPFLVILCCISGFWSCWQLSRPNCKDKGMPCSRNSWRKRKM